ncbi:hypothetical protein [uncultured Sanguibacteroides sp.]|uniref:hypothetical protein n=1 Tax=uncultured Sanguibacteroides sp. TaxID=1635151 RepID=UPI0025DDBBC6|nr:hypothetical protein [uncultured Sanguibacteroides sp.]
MISETPWDFLIEKNIDDFMIRYSDLKEIVQGGPIIGRLSINDKPILKYLFGGPCLNWDTYIYVPLFTKEIFKRGFCLCRINLLTREIGFLSKMEDLIYLDRIEGNKIYYYLDINRTKQQNCDIY